MSEQLKQFESRLRAHFVGLARTKAQSNDRVFALEHCFDAAEIETLSKELGKSLGKRGMVADFKLSWVVHAAEHGYNFDGQEYWHSFAQRTANWQFYGVRKRLRDWFRVFCAEFSGVRPQGEWATHYKYIAWPIAHALLPRDLQEQLAQSIYNAKYQLRTIAHLPPEATGRLIAQHSYASSSRFRFLLQQRDLVGRLVHALLRGESDTQTSIYPPTLQRITSDLNSRGHARAWLKDAQRQYAKLQIQLPSFKQSYWAQTFPQETEHDSNTTELSDQQGVVLQPTIELRRTASAQWQAVLLVPSFQPLVDAHPEFRKHLLRLRYTVPSHGDALFLGQTLLSARGMQYSLSNWPAQRQCVLSFDTSDVFFDSVVQPECQLRLANIWLFRRNADGSARYIATAHVVAGERYLVVSQDRSRIEGLGPLLPLRCSNVSCIELNLDAVISQSQKSALARAGLSLHSSIRIFPLGLLPRQWGEDSLGVWLTSETPCFRLTRDHEFDAYQITVDAGAIQTFDVAPNARSVNFMLEDLAVGRHRVSVATCIKSETSRGSHYRSVRTLELSLFVRQPTVWTPGALGFNAVVVDVHPPVPTIEDFLSGRIRLTVTGDQARRATCTLVLTDASNATLSSQAIAQDERLPVKESVWDERLADFLSRTSDEQVYLEAAGGYIRIDAEDLGEYRVPLLHHPEPLRWGTTTSKVASTLRLINDGYDKPLRIERLTFSQPMQRIAVPPEDARVGVDTRTTDGLFVAYAEDRGYAAVVSSTSTGKGFDWLGVQLDEHMMRQSRDDRELVETYALWAGARTCGTISRIRRAQVLEHIHNQLIAVVCGVSWIKAEKRLAGSNTPQPWEWEALDSEVTVPISYAAGLGRAFDTAGELLDENLEEIHRTVSLGFRIAQDPAVIRTAWLIAFDPALLLEGSLHPSGPSAQAFEVLVRGARLLLTSRKHGRKRTRTWLRA